MIRPARPHPINLTRAVLLHALNRLSRRHARRIDAQWDWWRAP